MPNPSRKEPGQVDSSSARISELNAIIRRAKSHGKKALAFRAELNDLLRTRNAAKKGANNVQ